MRRKTIMLLVCFLMIMALTGGCKACDTEGIYNSGFTAGQKQGYNDAYQKGYNEGYNKGFGFGESSGVEKEKNEMLERLSTVLIIVLALVIFLGIGYTLHLKFGKQQGLSYLSSLGKYVQNLFMWVIVPTVLLFLFLSGGAIALGRNTCTMQENCKTTAVICFGVGLSLLALTVISQRGGLLNAPNNPKKSILPILIGIALGVSFAIAMITISPSTRLFAGILTFLLTSSGLITLYLYFAFGEIRTNMALGIVSFIIGSLIVFGISETTNTMLSTFFPT